MSHITSEELKDLTGSVLTEAVLQTVIDEATRKVDMLCRRYNHAPSEDAARNMCLALARAGLVQRGRLDGTRGSSWSAGGLSRGDDQQGLVATLNAEAAQILEDDIAAQQQLQPGQAWATTIRGV